MPIPSHGRNNKYKMRINEIDLYKLHSNPEKLAQQDVRIQSSLTRAQFFKTYVLPKIYEVLGTDKVVVIKDDYGPNQTHRRIRQLIVENINAEKLLYQRPGLSIDQPITERNWGIMIIYPAAEKLRKFQFAEVTYDTPDVGGPGEPWGLSWYLPRTTYNFFHKTIAGVQ